MINTATFPQHSGRLLLSGKAGVLEVAVELPEVAIPQAPFFVMCHPNPLMGGTMDNKVVTTTCKAFNQIGIPSIRFNYRGVGQSAGSYGHIEGECEDLITVVEWVKKHWSSRPLWVGGFSFGSFIAYKMANTLGAAQLLSVAPAVSDENYAQTAEPEMPWTVVLPDADEVVSVTEAFAWLAQVKCSYHLIKMAGASHFFHGRLVELRSLLVRHFSPNVVNRLS